MSHHFPPRIIWRFEITILLYFSQVIRNTALCRHKLKGYDPKIHFGASKSGNLIKAPLKKSCAMFLQLLGLICLFLSTPSLTAVCCHGLEKGKGLKCFQVSRSVFLKPSILPLQKRVSQCFSNLFSFSEVHL